MKSHIENAPLGPTSPPNCEHLPCSRSAAGLSESVKGPPHWPAPGSFMRFLEQELLRSASELWPLTPSPLKPSCPWKIAFSFTAEKE